MGELPALRDLEKKEWIPARDIPGHLSLHADSSLDISSGGDGGNGNGNGNAGGFTMAQQAEIVAFREYVAQSLYPVLMCERWLDKKNFPKTRKVWACHSPLLLRMTGYMQWKEQRRVLTMLDSEHCNEAKKAHKRARRCLDTLVNRFFANSDTKASPSSLSPSHLFGDRPSSLDAVLAGTLYAALSATDLPTHKLRRLLQKHYKPLVVYCEFMAKTYLDEEPAFQASPEDEEEDGAVADEDGGKNGGKTDSKSSVVSKWLEKRLGSGGLKIPALAESLSYVVIAAAAVHLLFRSATRR